MTEPLAAAETAIRAGDPKAALASLTTAVKAAPANPKLRIFLAQLLCVLGQWERAHTQLNVVADMDSETGPMREMVGHALRCELLRAAVFSGKRSPMVFGQPAEWLAMLIESMLQAGQGHAEMADQLASRAFEAAPATAGQLNGEPFNWIADADSRLGPVLEAIVKGRYCWVPFCAITRIVVEPPTDLRDLVWVPARFALANGVENAALLPARYAGSGACEDGALQLARRTEWQALSGEHYSGLGQRLLTSNGPELGLLEVRDIVLRQAEATD